jgi:chemotaxis protein methyltransferase CheR
MTALRPANPERPPATDSVEGLSAQEFALFQRLVYVHTGISLGPHKQFMLRARLQHRLRALGLPTFTAYLRYLRCQGPDGEEMGRFINAVTTNVTEFFREPHHFRFLAERWLPAMRERAIREGRRSLRLWSAGCSTGEEPYSIAMVLQEALEAAAPAWDIRLLASDIDTDVLARASRGTYSLERVAWLPRARLVRFFLRGVGTDTGLVKVRPDLARMVTFRRINLVEEPWPISARFDVIFCRNVIIYFDRPSQERLLRRLLGMLQPDGLLFLGHSETLNGMFSGARLLENNIYQWGNHELHDPCRR